MTILLVLYLLLGLLIVILDFGRPIYNQPQYIRTKNLLMIILMILLWPVALIMRR